MNVIDKSFGISLRVMRILGLYSPNKKARFIKVQAYIMYFLFVIFIPLLMLIRFIVDKDLDTTQTNDNAGYLAQTVGFITKIIPFIRNRHQIRECIHFVEGLPFAVHTEEEKKIVDNCTRICRRNTRVFFVILLSGVVIWISKPILLDGYRLPLDLWLPFDPTAHWITYYSIYLVLAAALSYCGFLTMIDPLLGGLACQAVGQLQVLKYNLQHLAAEAEYHRDVYGKIVKCIDHHNAILNFVKLYEECFSSVVFSQFAASVFALCFCSLQLSKMEEFKMDTVSSALSNLSIILAQIYFYCYYGTLIFEENYSLTNAIYMGQWYEYDVKSRRALIILMERSKPPMIVTAGKVLDLSLETFTMIVRRAYSLLAVLGNYDQVSDIDIST